MTGFGREDRTDDRWSVTVEIRTVNHRFCDISARLPKGYHSLEERIRRLVTERIERGRAEIFLSIEEFGGRERTVILDQALLRGYLNALSEAEAVVQQRLDFRVDMLVQLPGVLELKEEEQDPEALWPMVSSAIAAALDKVQQMRLEEGTRLQADIVGRMKRLAEIIDRIESLAPEATARYRQRLTEQIAQYLGALPVDEQRIAQEVAHFAEKSNIDEELTRARSHVEQFVLTCETGGSVGRKLDFVIQELNREINTIASKAQDSAIANLVVEAKAELEKVREQVQNVQ